MYLHMFVIFPSCLSLPLSLSPQAVEMYTDLCEFELAKQYMKISPTKTPAVIRADKEENAAIKELITKQAEWASTTNDSKTAV